MTINYFIIGTSLIVVGVGVYYLIKTKGGTNNPLPQDITFKETDIIRLSDIGPWLKEKDVDFEDFGKVSKLYVFKNFKISVGDFHLSEKIIAQLQDGGKSEAVAFVLSDMSYNTKSVFIVAGDSIEPKLELLMKQDVTELNIH